MLSSNFWQDRTTITLNTFVNGNTVIKSHVLIPYKKLMQYSPYTYYLHAVLYTMYKIQNKIQNTMPNGNDTQINKCSHKMAMNGKSPGKSY